MNEFLEDMGEFLDSLESLGEETDKVTVIYWDDNGDEITVKHHVNCNSYNRKGDEK